MRLSFRHRYVMFDIPKSASTSINSALSRVAECVLDGNGGMKHVGVEDFETYLEPLLARRSGMSTDTFERIAVVREPVDMLMSYFKYLQRPGTETPGHVDHDRNTVGMAFDRFCEAVVAEYQRRTPFRFRVSRPSTFIRSADGTVGIDALFAFGRLNDLAAHMSEKTGVQIEIPRRNVSAMGDLPTLPSVLMGDLRQVMADDFLLHDLVAAQPPLTPLRMRGQTLGTGPVAKKTPFAVENRTTGAVLS